MGGRIRLVACDLDGTLLRPETCCEALARPLGRLERMREFERLHTVAEITAARTGHCQLERAVWRGDCLRAWLARGSVRIRRPRPRR